MFLSENHVAHNIKTLRSVYKETREELANIIGLPGINAQQNIYNYESGRCQPPLDIIKKIAYHYNVSVEDLIYEDLSSFKLDTKKVDVEKFYKFIQSFFLFFEKSKVDDPDFQNAYDLAIRILDSASQGIPPLTTMI